MAVKESRYVSAFSKGALSHVPHNVCKYWLQGRCNRNPCRFSHALPSEVAADLQRYPRKPNTYHRLPKQPGNPATGVRPNNNFLNEERHGKSANPNVSVKPKGMNKSIGRPGRNKPEDKAKDSRSAEGKLRDTNHKNSQLEVSASLEDKDNKKIQKLCSHWAVDSCVHGDSCQFIHSWSIGEDFSSLATLKGHSKPISGIALPSDSDKLYSGSRDGSIHAWDCNSGKCAQSINVGDEIGSMISEGPWIFVGMPNVIKAWNVQTSAEFDLTGPVGQVYTMAVSHDMLFAGTQDGSVLVWKGSSESNPFQLIASLRGHSLPVVSFAVGRKRLYSGSSDHTIRVWDTETLQCVQTLHGHSHAVMSLICWDDYLLSCSLDKTIKVWAATDGGSLEVVYTHTEDEGVLALGGMTDAEAKPVLFRSCKDNTVCLYDLPSFKERGRIFTKKEVTAIQIGQGGLFFTGDGTGLLNVWKWLGEPKVGV